MRISGPILGGGSGGGISQDLKMAGNGMVFLRDGVFVTHIPRGVMPIDMTDASGKGGAPRILSAPAGLLGPFWEPDAAPQRLSGNTIADQPIRMMGYRRYVIERIDVIDPTGAAGALRCGLYSAPNGGGKAILPAGSRFDQLTGGLRDRVTLLPGDVDCEAPDLFFRVGTVNATPISFVMLIWGRALMGADE